MTKTIMKHLTENRSYFKWGTARLASKFGCSVKTVENAIQKLSRVKNAYLKSLKD